MKCASFCVSLHCALLLCHDVGHYVNIGTAITPVFYKVKYLVDSIPRQSSVQSVFSWREWSIVFGDWGHTVGRAAVVTEADLHNSSITHGQGCRGLQGSLINVFVSIFLSLSFPPHTHMHTGRWRQVSNEKQKPGVLKALMLYQRPGDNGKMQGTRGLENTL